MQDSLAIHAGIIKGFLIGSAAPEAVVKSIDFILENAQSFVKSSPFNVKLKANESFIEKEENNKQNRIKSDAIKKDHQIIKTDRKSEVYFRLLENKDDIQARHDRNETNGQIAEIYHCSDQTIVNFLSQEGRYNSRAEKAKSKKKLQ